MTGPEQAALFYGFSLEDHVSQAATRSTLSF